MFEWLAALPEWVLWMLIAVAGGLGLSLFGSSRRSMNAKNRERFNERYDPVRLQQQEAMYPTAHASSPDKK